MVIRIQSINLLMHHTMCHVSNVWLITFHHSMLRQGLTQEFPLKGAKLCWWFQLKQSFIVAALSLIDIFSIADNCS